jgi:magnesium-transporting ATPase (P-type)
LLLRGTAIVNEAMLSGESTPLLKESIELREGEDRLDMNGADRNSVLFSGTKALQVEQPGEGGIKSESRHDPADKPPTVAVSPKSCVPVSARPRGSSSGP